ncbi:MAG: branched-chain amino acid transport system II carrier protein [Eubacteriales bacterium]|nr:branched-chain amino acid transport system II carrier protein [Eubacteriales bacterium]
MKQSRMLDILVIGLALFSMFFGAGNIIFPPYLGMESASQWILGFSSYYLADIGLAVVAIFAVLKYKGDVNYFMSFVGNIPGKIMLSAIILCIGPLIAVPRTGATTYEMFVVPVFGNVSPVVPVFLFFAAIALLSIRPSSVVDILGKFLTPALFFGLIFLIIKGILTPVGTIVDTFKVESVVQQGISAGYQTMDSLAAVVFGMIIVNTVKNKGYTQEQEQYKIAMYASCLAAAGLLLVYGGLTYLGATATSNMQGRLLRTELILYITRELLGKFGVILLGVVVTLACITTAVALITASAEYFCNLSKGKLRYSFLVIFFCAFSALFATLGTDTIVSIAAPILGLLYPGMLVLIACSFVAKRLKSNLIIRFAVFGAILTSLCEFLYTKRFPFSFVTKLPLAGSGFGWIVPSIVFGCIGAILSFLSNKKTAGR